MAYPVLGVGHVSTWPYLYDYTAALTFLRTWSALGVDVLGAGALQFLELARLALKRGFLELVLFSVEQFARLYAKCMYRGLGIFRHLGREGGPWHV